MGSECYSGKSSFLAKIFFSLQHIWNVKTAGLSFMLSFIIPKMTLFLYSHLFIYVVSMVSRRFENYSYTLLFARSLAICINIFPTGKKNK